MHEYPPFSNDNTYDMIIMSLSTERRTSGFNLCIKVHIVKQLEQSSKCRENVK